MKTLGNFFRVMTKNKHTSWPNYVQIIQNIINEIHSEATGFTPIELQLNKKPTRFWKNYLSTNNENNDLKYEEKLFLAKERIRKKREDSNNKANEGRTIIKFNVGDKVLLKANNLSNNENNEFAKFMNLYVGPKRAKCSGQPLLIEQCTRMVSGARAHLHI